MPLVRWPAIFDTRLFSFGSDSILRSILVRARLTAARVTGPSACTNLSAVTTNSFPCRIGEWTGGKTAFDHGTRIATSWWRAASAVSKVASLQLRRRASCASQASVTCFGPCK